MRWLIVACLVGTAAAAPAPVRVDLTWVVHPPPKTSKDDYPKQPLDLVIKVGTTTKTIKLAPQMGSLKPYNQALCKTGAYPYEVGEVAKITFYEGGAGGYFIRRAKPGFELVDWGQTDGACDDGKGGMTVCPRSEKFVQRLDLPEDGKFVESIVEIDDAGKRHTLSCKGL
jgi:hypothetical protein